MIQKEDYTEEEILILNSNKGLHALLSQKKGFDLKRAIRHAKTGKKN